MSESQKKVNKAYKDLEKEGFTKDQIVSLVTLMEIKIDVLYDFVVEQVDQLKKEYAEIFDDHLAYNKNEREEIKKEIIKIIKSHDHKKYSGRVIIPL